MVGLKKNECDGTPLRTEVNLLLNHTLRAARNRSFPFNPLRQRVSFFSFAGNRMEQV